jgi:FSR family fosmidomycin resistance protein-like MFS transporter
MRDVAVGFLIYNVLAFGGQYFAARFLEKVSNIKPIITACALFNVIAVGLFHLIPQLSLVLAGCASAVYHVAGASACIRENKAAPIGVFAAPGIIGLAIAGYLSYLKIDIRLFLSIVCVTFVGLMQLIQLPSSDKQSKVEDEKKDHRVIDNHDVLMILLLGIISMRSAVWNIFQVIHEHNYTWLLAIAASAFLGKILGGWISDKIGWKLYSFVSLIAAMPLVSFFKEEIVLYWHRLVAISHSRQYGNDDRILQGKKGERDCFFLWNGNCFRNYIDISCAILFNQWNGVLAFVQPFVIHTAHNKKKTAL